MSMNSSNRLITNFKGEKSYLPQKTNSGVINKIKIKTKTKLSQ